MSDNQNTLEIVRHSCAHLLAQAVKQLFPDVQIAIGPAVEDGFYYDFALAHPFSPADLEAIEKRMKELAAKDYKVERLVMSHSQALDFFKEKNEPYKIEILKEIPPDVEITLYRQGDFTDLCRGPHVQNTKELKAFKLTKLAGAYWRGDSKREMLQRIYGTAWLTQKDLDCYFERLKEAEKRDHRKIGRIMDLFHIQEEAPGMIFWHDKGWTIYQIILDYLRQKLREHDYQIISAPMILDRSLWEKSGHWEKFGQQGMFITSSESRDYVIKPMNCPGHIQIFNQGITSYRDLPLRIAEFGVCHRNEASGTLHGLMRIRQFMVDDAHVFCTPGQLNCEINNLISYVQEVYNDFGFNDIVVRLATRPEKRIGSDEVWDLAEKTLSDVLKSRNIPFSLALGDGAFYGPKIELHLRDCLDRLWQCGTIQIDFSMPDRLGARYIDENGERKIPVMVHRAIIGSIERFIGILLEHYSGFLPLWLTPIQVVVMNITDRQSNFVGEIVSEFKKHNIRAISDLRNEKIGFKIREYTLQKIPYFVIVGDRELDKREISVRTRSGENLETMPISAFVDRLQTEIFHKK